ncbi:MAG: hypothetical protein IPH31_23925 [Lewinellaceae bacterium]|nr:hypothetical protein [Lewinellaceae bacterium]
MNNQTDYQVIGVLKDIPSNTDLRYQIYCSWATLSADQDFKRLLENWGGIHGGTQCFAVLREGHTAAELETAFVGFRKNISIPGCVSFITTQRLWPPFISILT